MKRTIEVETVFGRTTLTLIPVDEFCQRCGYFTSVWKADDESMWEGYGSRFCTKCSYVWNASEATKVDKADKERQRIMEVLNAREGSVSDLSDRIELE